MKQKLWVQVMSFIVSVLIAGYLFIMLFRLLPVENTSLGLDWRTLWNSVCRGRVVYARPENQIGGMFTPPWGVLFLLPFGFISFEASWGLISLLSIVGLVFSVPKKHGRLDIVGIVLLALSFPSLRNLADGNLGGIVVGGIALVVWGYNTQNIYAFAAGLLLATLKPQETWLLCGSVVALTFREWSLATRRRTFLLAGGVVLFSMALWGDQWIRALFVGRSHEIGLSAVMGRGSLIDISLSAALARLGMSGRWIAAAWGGLFLVTIGFLWRYRSRYLTWPPVAFLVSSSMLLSPYVSSGNSFLTIVAVALIPLWQEYKLAGALALILTSLPFLASRAMLFSYQAYYWSALLLVVWSGVGIKVFLASSCPLLTAATRMGGEHGEGGRE